MPGFPDKFVPFMEQPPGAIMSTQAVSVYGKTVKSLRQFTLASMNREPSVRRKPGASPTEDDTTSPEADR
jgi:hydrogenase small subunit